MSLIPGQILAGDSAPVAIGVGRERRTLRVQNAGDRPIQVGSHFQFSDANGALDFDRELAQGFRLDIAAGTSVRFEPGVELEVTLVALAGARQVPGLQIKGGAR